MMVSDIICKHLNQKLTRGLLAMPSCDGAMVIRTPTSERRPIIDLWRGFDGLWYWKSLFLGNELAGSGTIFDGINAVERAVKNETEYNQMLGSS